MFVVPTHHEQPVITIVSPPPESPSPSPGPASSAERSPSSASSSSSAEVASPPLPATIPAHAPEPPAIVQSELHQNAKRFDSPIAGPSMLSSPGTSSERMGMPRKSSTFRHVPLRPQNARQPLSSSPLRPADTHSRTPSSISSSSRHLDTPTRSDSNNYADADSTSSPATIRSGLPTTSTPEIIPQLSSPNPSFHAPQTVVADSLGPIQRSSSLGPVSPPRTATPSPSATSPASIPSPASSSASLHTRAPTRSSVPYRPGFQPKGVYRPRTDEFLLERKAKQNEDRIERTRLERRLEKLINLHFSSHDAQKEKETLSAVRPRQQNKRMSSIWDFDLSDLRNKSAGDLWRDVLQSQAPHTAKADIRGLLSPLTSFRVVKLLIYMVLSG